MLGIMTFILLINNTTNIFWELWLPTKFLTIAIWKIILFKLFPFCFYLRAWVIRFRSYRLLRRRPPETLYFSTRRLKPFLFLQPFDVNVKCSWPLVTAIGEILKRVPSKSNNKSFPVKIKENFVSDWTARHGNRGNPEAIAVKVKQQVNSCKH